MNNGSILILTIIAVLILSIMISGLLTVGTTEIQTTQNFHLNKSAYYTAVQGVEEVRNLIYSTPDAQTVSQITKSIADTQTEESGLKHYFITGTLKELEAGGSGVPVTPFKGFEAPPLVGMQLGGNTSISPAVWKVEVSSAVSAGTKNAYAEITAGVYSVIVSGY
ncbi:MAG: hypothetical protein ACM3SY_06865 [Candidatus Omnitrophota bacterium]